MNDRDGRPSPDALLKEAARQAAGRGKLKIFLGAAPGVGKTYEMLSSAQARLREGVDVVIGIVETHGRAETESLIGGLEVLARKQIDYKGRQLDEMDLDGLLARRPALALVDELAHSNVGAAAIPSGISMSRNCSPPGSTSTPRSTSSTSRASMTWWHRSPASGCARRFRIPSSTAPTRSR
jgi:hypothetical protein